MPKRYDWSEWTNEMAGGAKDLAGEVGQAAKQVYCNLVQTSPFSAMYDNKLTLPVVKRALKNFCGQDPPPPPELPFTGGQCAAILYRVSYRYKVTEGAAEVAEIASVWGSVRGLEVRDYSATSKVLSISAGDGTVQDNQKYYDIRFAATSTSPFPSYSIDNVVRGDNQPDTCGDLPEPFYDPTDPPPPSSITNVTTNVTNNYGDNNDYDVTINPDGGGHIRFPPILNVNGVSVSVDATGVSIGEININRRSGGGGGNGDDINITSDPEPIVETEEQDPEPIEDDTLEKDAENLIGIYVDITSKPLNAKIVSGNGSPNIIYAGWVEYKRESGYFPRTFIDFENGYFPAPSDATGYAVCLKKGYNGQIREVKEKQQ